MTLRFNFGCSEEKYVSNLKIDIMQWSPLMDLIAVSTTAGEVHLYRWGWQKVWAKQKVLDSDSKRAQAVRALEWRPDGRVLAVGYSAGLLRLYSFDQGGKCLHEVNTSDRLSVNALKWNEYDADCSQHQWTKAKTYLPIYEDLFQHKAFDYPQLREIHKFLTEEIPKMEKKFSVLVVVTPGRILFFIYGMWQMASYSALDIARRTWNGRAPPLQVVNCHLSPDLRTANIVLRMKPSTAEDPRSATRSPNHSASGSGSGSTPSTSSDMRQHRIVSFSTSFLAEHHLQLRNITLQLIAITHIIKEMQSVNKYLSELWEDTVLDLDSKLTKYNEKRMSKDPNYSLKTELLELLLFGHCNEELREFLVRQWTSKGLKSLGTSIENTYINLMTYLFRVHHMLVHACLFHLNELHTCTLDEQYEHELKDCQHTVLSILYTVGGVLAKSQEMQVVIHKGLTNLHAFFTWLNRSILYLAGEDVPTDMYTTTPDHRKKVVDFINDHLVAIPDKETGKPHFRLERVEQYLQDGELKHPVDTHQWTADSHPWMEYLNKHPLDEHFVYPQYQSTLSEVHNELVEKKLPTLNNQIQTNLMQRMFNRVLGPIPSCSSGKQTRFCGFYTTNNGQEEFFTCFLYPKSNKILIIRKSGESHAGSVLLIDAIPDSTLTEDEMAVEAVAKYNDQLLCVLVRNISQERADSCLLFLGLEVLSGLLRQADGPDVSDAATVRLSEVMGSLELISDHTKFPSRPVAMAVSGERNLLCIVFESKQKFRLYMLDPMEEETQ